MPVGLATAFVPGLAMLTVAVKVTAWPDTLGLAEEVRVVVVSAWLTTWERYRPGAEDEVVVAGVDGGDRVRAAADRQGAGAEGGSRPRNSSGAGTDVVVPSMKVTVPVGTPAPGDAAATVAVNVTAWPKTLGLTERSGWWWSG